MSAQREAVAGGGGDTDRDRAVIRLEQAGDVGEESRLRSRSAPRSRARVGRYGEIDPVEGDDLAERLPDAADLDRRRRVAVSPTGDGHRELWLTSHRISV